MPNKIDDTNTSVLDNPHDIHWRAGHAQKRLRRTAMSQAMHDRAYRKQIKVAQRKQAKAARQAQRAEELRAAGKGKQAARAERRARLARESADRIRAKAEQRWRERTTRTARKRTALKWALAATLAATTAVAAGWTVVAPSVYGNDLVKPTGNEVEIGLPPQVEGDPPRPEPAPEEAAADEAADEQADDGQAAAEEAADDEPTGVIVHVVDVGDGAGASGEVLAGVPFTIVSLENGSTISETTVKTSHGSLTALNTLPPGRYRVTVDGSTAKNPDCANQYTAEINLKKGEQHIATAYFADQAVGGTNSYTPNCFAVVRRTAE